MLADMPILGSALYSIQHLFFLRKPLVVGHFRFSLFSLVTTQVVYLPEWTQTELITGISGQNCESNSLFLKEFRKKMHSGIVS